jgi:protein tyrosine/serine phosphatase
MSSPRGLLIALLPTLLAGCSNFHIVEPGRFYRSAQPSQAQLESWIDTYELKTVVSLRGGSPDNPDLVASRTAAENKGIRFVQHKLRARRYPTKPELLGLWKIFAEGEYPMLVHCQSGVDRSGLASGVYLLWRTGDVDQADEQLDFFPYWHTGWFGSYKLDRVFEMYRPSKDRLSFPEWVETEYKNPDQEHEPSQLHPRPAA